MNKRLSRFARDWKSYVGMVAGLSSGLTAFTDALDKARGAFAGLRGLPPETRWLAALVLGGLALLALATALSRRSLLLRPERFVVSADEPDHLVGREQEIKALCTECERHHLVFLVGESGAGKSALVRSGVVPRYQAPDGEQVFVPVLVDLSAVAWHNGLRKALATSISALSDEERQALGIEQAIEPETIFDSLGRLPGSPGRRLLIIPGRGRAVENARPSPLW